MIALFLLAAAPPPAVPLTGRMLASRCVLRGTFAGDGCTPYILNVANAMAARRELCFGGPFPREAMAATVQHYLQAHPALLNQPADQLVAAALGEPYSCTHPIGPHLARP